MGKYDDVRMQWVGRRAGQQTFFVLTDVSQEILPANGSRVWASIQNTSGSNNVHIALGETAIVPAAGQGTGLTLGPGDILIFDGNMPWPYLVCAICDAGLTAAVLVNDVVQVIRNYPGRGVKQDNPPIPEYGE